MDEKVAQLYKKYLDEKLDIIFDDKNTTKIPNLIEEKNTWPEDRYDEYGLRQVVNHPRGGDRNFVKRDGSLLCDHWFSKIDGFHDGYAIVRLNGRDRIIDTKGEYAFDKWYDEISEMSEGYAVVMNNSKYNLIDMQGNLVSKDWYDYAFGFHDGCALVKNDYKSYFINTKGEFIGNSKKGYDGATNFENGFAIVKKNGKYNYINTEGKEISDEWFLEAYPFKEGYGRVKKSEGYTFIDKAGKPISNKYYESLDDFKDGLALVRRNKKQNCLNTKGELISKTDYDKINEFHDGCAVVCNNDNYNFINLNGRLLSDTWYDNVGDFYDGCAMISTDEGKNFINTKGELISKTYFDSVKHFSEGLAAVYKDKKLNYIDTKGNLISEKWFPYTSSYKDHSFKNGLAHLYNSMSNSYTIINKKCEKIAKTFDEITVLANFNDCLLIQGDFNFTYIYDALNNKKIDAFDCRLFTVNNNFIYYETHTNGFLPGEMPHNIPYAECRTKDMKDYKIKSGLLDGFICKNKDYKFKVTYAPIKFYNFTYTLCMNSDNVYMHDVQEDEDIFLGKCNEVIFDDNFIINNEKKKAYFMHDEQFIDISDYYFNNLKDKKEINVYKGKVDIMSREDFVFLNMVEIDAVLKQELEKNKKIREEQEKQIQVDTLKQVEIQNQNNREQTRIRTKELLEQLKSVLSELNEIKDSDIKVPYEHLFNTKNDHFEFAPGIVESLQHIDLSFTSFSNVKVNGIDFGGCNISISKKLFDPQEVYNMDISSCNFEGIFIDPFVDFTGVNIKGSKFSFDDDPRTFDMFNRTFKDAIYDETTTFNGKPISEIIEENKNKGLSV